MAQEKAVPGDTPGEIDLNPSIILERLDSWLDSAIRIIPNLVLAIIVVAIASLVAIYLQKMISARLARQGRHDLGRMLGGLVKWSVIFLFVLLAATIVMPSLSPGDLIAGLGVSSVAIGFAFKDILQNWLAGLLILLRQPFEIGDQIEAAGYEGTAERIETRSTIIKTYDGQRAVIPNSEMYTSAVLVKTAHGCRRSQYDIGIGYGDDMDEAMEILVAKLKEIDEIVDDPAPEAIPWDLAASWVTIRLRWWTDSARSDVVQVRAKVIRLIKNAMDDAKIDMPYETRVHLFHDQTEEVDGDPARQREGWPERSDETPRPRWEAEIEKKKEAG